jgi:NADH-quinone oxidoreductase subunit J
MTMEAIFFYIFAVLAVLCAVMVVANPFSKNPITSALFLVLTIISLAGLFVLLNAYFIAAVQILVYAGAVIVLFLFVLMLIDLREEMRKKVKLTALISGVAAVVGLFYVILKGVSGSAVERGKTLVDGSPSALGVAMFSQGRFLLPFEVVSVLLLVAIVGAVFLGAKEGSNSSMTEKERQR